jgi:DNA-binding transcriptional regulator YdaS (Cro superfamily)
MSDWLTEEDARARLVRAVAEAGSQDAFSRAVGCSPSLVSHALAGTKPVGPKLGAALGLIANAQKTYRYLVKG